MKSTYPEEREFQSCFDLEFGTLAEEEILMHLDCQPQLASTTFKVAFSGDVYPLYLMVMLGGSLDGIKQVLACFPKAVEQVDELGNTLLHEAISRQRGDAILLFLIKEYPKALQLRNRYSLAPLELACRGGSGDSGVSLPTIKCMLFLTPIDGGRSDTLLHIACSAGMPNYDLIDYLLDCNPRNASILDSEGCFPLHKLLSKARVNPVPIAVMERMVSLNPAALSMTSSRHCKSGQVTPLHLACQHRAPLEVIELLYCDEAAGMSCMGSSNNKFYSTPLHIAFVQRATPEVLEFLLARYPLEEFRGVGCPLPIQSDFCDALRRGLAANKSIRRVSLVHVGLGCNGCEAIFKALESNITVEQLYLGGTSASKAVRG